jgi:hypothetical protein
MNLQALLPKAWRGEHRAIERFRSELDETRSELDKLKRKGKRVSPSLIKRRQYLTDFRQDELKLAIMQAENFDHPRRDMLYEFYKLTLRDGHIHGEYEKAIFKVVGSPFAVFKKGSEEIDELATRLLQKNWFEEYRQYYEETRFHGHSLVQFLDMVPSEEPGMQMEFKYVELIAREHVRPEQGVIVLDISHENGIPFRDEQIKKALRLIEMGKPDNLGILLIAAAESIWKKYTRSDWSRHSEKFGMPTIIARLATSDKTEVDKTEDMLSNFGNNLWAILDKDDEVDVKESAQPNAFQIYKEKVLMCNSEISKLFTWQTGTSDEKSFVGSAEVHERVLNEYVEARKRKQTFHINDELFPFLIEHGYPLKDREFRYLDYQQSDPEEEQQEATDKKKTDSPGGGKEKKQQARYRHTMKSMLR